MQRLWYGNCKKQPEGEIIVITGNFAHIGNFDYLLKFNLVEIRLKWNYLIKILK